VRTFADETATCAVHKRWFTRAAGVSPPWSMKQPLCGENPTLGRRLARRQSRAAGVSPPWERNASAMARVFPGASTFAHHGGLTPPALGCMCGCHCRYTLRTNEYAAFPTAGSRPPALGCTCGCCCRYAFVTGEHASVSHGWLTSAAPGGWRWDDSQNRRL
jgi:hypothetical protein